MNILVSCGVFHPHKGGAEALFGDLGELLTENGHGVDVITRRLPHTSETESYRGASIHRFDYPVSYGRFKTQPEFHDRSVAILNRLRALISTRQIGVVCIGLLDMSVMYLLALRRVMSFRLILYLHGGEMRGMPEVSPSYKELLDHCFDDSDAIISVSNGLAEEAMRSYPDVHQKLHVVRNGFDLKRLRECPANQAKRPYILFVGRLHEQKNVGLILRAFRVFVDRAGAADLILAGTGEEEESLKALAAELNLGDRVTFIGAQSRDQVFALMKGALCLVLASESEGLPIVVLEAFGARLPVVAPSVAGITELVAHNQNGLLFEFGDANQMAELMLRLSSSPDLLEDLRDNVAWLDVERYDLRSLWRSHLAIWTGDPAAGAWRA